jgi:hypothetical protein
MTVRRQPQQQLIAQRQQFNPSVFDSHKECIYISSRFASFLQEHP